MDEARQKEIKEAEAKKDPEVVRKAKFEIDFEKVDLSKMEEYKNQSGIYKHFNPYYQIFQSLLGLAKVQKYRIKTESSENIYKFLLKLTSLILFGNEENQNSLTHAMLHQ
jgi:hypothetical protein